MLISLEGVEGCGKSTQAARLQERLVQAGYAVEAVRDPGDTAVGDRVRELLLHSQARIDGLSELLLFWVARRQLIVERIAPALAAGKLVLTDRYFDSTAAYQVYGRGLSMAHQQWLRQTVCDGCEPELTVVLDLDPAVGLQRAVGDTAPDRIEAEGREFLQRVREGFLALARAEPGRMVVVPVVEGVEATADAVWQVVEPHVRTHRVAGREENR